MNFLTWNCRGTGAKSFPNMIRDIRREYEVSLIFLLETHASGANAQRQAKKTGLSGSFILDSRGQSGGIWCLWDKDKWKIEILESSQQFVHLKVTWKGRISWLCTVVYASTSCTRRQELWEDLSRLASQLNEPWVVLGDFNCIGADHERKGGSTNFSHRGMLQFRNMLQSCNVMDAGFQGSPFTWKHGNLFQRLDRVLMNIQWCIKFQNVAVFHLPFFKSDHRALLVRMSQRNKPNRNRRPFRFMASWFSHETFPLLMLNAWPRGAS